MDKVIRHSRRAVIALIGSVIILLGIVLIPYPGPGWLVVFAGFAVLATEFEFATRMLAWLRKNYDAWVVWVKQRHLTVRLLMLGGTGAVLVLTAWLLNTFGLINGFLQLGQDWLISPFFI